MYRTYLVDVENTSYFILNFKDHLHSTDAIYFFTSKHCTESPTTLDKLICPVFFEECTTGRKNELDMQLMSKFGYILAQDKYRAYQIFAKDDDYSPIIDFWKREGYVCNLSAQIYSTKLNFHTSPVDWRFMPVRDISPINLTDYLDYLQDPLNNDYGKQVVQNANTLCNSWQEFMWYILQSLRENTFRVLAYLPTIYMMFGKNLDTLPKELQPITADYKDLENAVKTLNDTVTLICNKIAIPTPCQISTHLFRGGMVHGERSVAK